VPGKHKGKILTALPKAGAQPSGAQERTKRDRSSNPALRINQNREGQGTREYREGRKGRGTRPVASVRNRVVLNLESPRKRK
jgi:hypothetical protein